MTKFWTGFTISSAFIIGVLVGGPAGYWVRKNGERIAGPHFIVGNAKTDGFFMCIAEFDKRGQLVRHGKDEKK